MPPRFTEHQIACVIRGLKPFDPAVIYLFGSFGTDSQHRGSDIDLAFLTSSPVDPMDCFQAANRLADQLGHSVDLVNLSEASTVLAKEVIRTGIPIHITHPGLHQQFEMLTLSDYARLNEERQPVLAS